MIKNIRHIIFAIILLVANSANAQLLYQISGKSARSKSYIFATNRLADIQFLDSVPNLFKCYADCDKVITEMALNSNEALSALKQASLLPDSVRLSNFYSDDEYQTINDALEITLGMGLDKLGRMKPAYLTEMYRTELARKWLAYDENRSCEVFFETVAVQQDKPIIGLDDTGETMYMLFDREPFHWQCKELLKVIEYPEKEVKQDKRLLELYKKGLLTETAYQVSMPDNSSSISFSDYQIFAKRNKEWVKRLAPYLAEGNAFITLNAIYLGGDNGLLALLRAAGYKVKPVNK